MPFSVLFFEGWGAVEPAITVNGIYNTTNNLCGIVYQLLERNGNLPWSRKKTCFCW